MNYAFLKIAAVTAVLLGLFGALMFMGEKRSPSSGEGTTLRMYCAAGLSEPVAEIAKLYEEEYGVELNVSYAGSGQLMASFQAGDDGDLYLSADQSYISQGHEQELLDETLQIAWQSPVLIVQKDNPHGIHSLQDVLDNRDELRIVLPNPEVTAVGRVVQERLEDAEHWEELWEAKLTVRDTVNMVANDISKKIADVGIVWDATATQYEDLLAIEIPELAGARSTISVAVIHRTEQPTEALRFARYLTASDRGLPVFEKYNYDVIADGDQWADHPEIVVFVGGVNRPAVEETIRKFSEREGVEVLPTYNGCGVLVGQMKAGANPDMYLSCDVSFMEMVQDRFYDSINISSTAMVIITPKGNPLGISTLADLTRPGLKVGVTNHELSALGELTKQLLERNNLWDELSSGFEDQPSTADVLVIQVVLGALDAAIVYRANTHEQIDNLEVISIDDPSAFAIQPIAIARDSKHKHLTQRLVQQIRSVQSAALFQELGFSWLNDPSVLIPLSDQDQ